MENWIPKHKHIFTWYFSWRERNLYYMVVHLLQRVSKSKCLRCQLVLSISSSHFDGVKKTVLCKTYENPSCKNGQKHDAVPEKFPEIQFFDIFTHRTYKSNSLPLFLWSFCLFSFLLQFKNIEYILCTHIININECTSWHSTVLISFSLHVTKETSYWLSL